MIRILIADDHKRFAETLAAMLRMNADFEVIAICLNTADAMEAVAAKKPDVVLMDMNIKPVSGPAATMKLAAFPYIKVIGLSMHSDPSYCNKMLHAGAAGYVTKNSPTSEIFSAIREVVKGNEYICEDTKKIIAEQLITGVSEDVYDKSHADAAEKPDREETKSFSASNITSNNLLQKIGKLYWLSFRKNSA